MYKIITRCLSIGGRLLFPTLVLIGSIILNPSYACRGEPIPSTVIYVFHGQHNSELYNSEKYIIGRDLLPLRDSVKSMGVLVKWNSGPITPNQSVTTFSVQIGSKEVIFNGGRRDCKVFFLEQAPIIVSNQTMVSYGLLREIADKTANREVNLKTLAGLKTGNMIDKSEDGGYKYYDLLIGDPCGPSFEKARVFVLKNGYLTSIKLLEYTPIRHDTMVVGGDINGREKRIWLGQNPYTEEIFVTGSAYSDEGIMREALIKKLNSRGIQEQSIKTISIFPHISGKICWFVEVQEGNNSAIYYYDFYSGAEFD